MCSFKGIRRPSWGASSTPAEIYSKPPSKRLLRVIFHRKTAKKAFEAGLSREILAYKKIEVPSYTVGAVADADHLVHQIGGWHVDHAFLASADHLEAVVGVGDATGHERWREFQHHVPAHGYDVGVFLPRRAHQHHGTRFQIASDLRHWIIFLSEC